MEEKNQKERKNRFRGEYQHKLDAKGRVAIPARFKSVMDALGEDFLILSVSRVDNLLNAYTLEAWEAVEDRFLAVEETDEMDRRIQRNANRIYECPIDSQGRILIPPQAREKVGIEKDVVMIGRTTFFEILSKEQSDLYDKLAEEDAKSPEGRKKIAQYKL